MSEPLSPERLEEFRSAVAIDDEDTPWSSTVIRELLDEVDRLSDLLADEEGLSTSMWDDHGRLLGSLNDHVQTLVEALDAAREHYV